MSWGGIPARGEIEMPPSPFPDVRTRDLSEEEQHVLWKYKKVCQGLYEKNTSNLSKQVSFELSLKVAERFQKFPAYTSFINVIIGVVCTRLLSTLALKLTQLLRLN